MLQLVLFRQDAQRIKALQDLLCSARAVSLVRL